MVLFGYGGCPMCQRITDSVARIQQELAKEGKDIPFVVVSVQPEADRADLKSYIGSYYYKGVKQFKDETLPSDLDKCREMGEISYEQARTKPQGSRILHVVCPPTQEKAQELQQRIGLMINPRDPKQHSSFITLFDKGKAVKAYRGLSGGGDDTGKYHTELAATVVADVTTAQERKEVPAVAPPAKSNATLWNILVPAVTAIGAGWLGGGGTLSLKAALVALVSGTAASFATQWATGSGAFDSTKTGAAPRKPAGEKAPSAEPALTGSSIPAIPVNQEKARQEAGIIRLNDIFPPVQPQANPPKGGTADLPAPKSAGYSL